jgi:hypothetical protein
MLPCTPYSREKKTVLLQSVCSCKTSLNLVTYGQEFNGALHHDLGYQLWFNIETMTIPFGSSDLRRQAL